MSAKRERSWSSPSGAISRKTVISKLGSTRIAPLPSASVGQSPIPSMDRPISVKRARAFPSVLRPITTEAVIARDAMINDVKTQLDASQAALSAIPFLVTILGLYFIIFKPMFQYLDERLKAMEGGAAEAKGLEARIVEQTAEYEQKLKSARVQIMPEDMSTSPDCRPWVMIGRAAARE